MKTKLKQRICSLLLCGTMLFSTLPVNALAVENSYQHTSGLCEHHTEHTADCGYTEGIPGTPCNHEHTDECYTLVTECVHEHTEDCYPAKGVSDNTATPSEPDKADPTACTHECSEESGCITKALDCPHEHDSECGYAPATEGTPCTFVCEKCNPVDSGNQPEDAVTVESVQAMIDSLPGEDEISEDNAGDVQAQLTAIDEAMAELTDEEAAQLDMTRYLEAAAALKGLYEEVATPANAVLLADYNGPAIVPGTDHLAGGQASNIYYGNYQQSDTTGRTKDPIKCRVLSNADGKLFLLSDQNLDVFQYHTDRESVTWEKSTMRSWLNGYGVEQNNGGDSGNDYTDDNFIDTAFSDKERGAIADTTVVNNNNPDYNTDGGNDTTDKIFLLSIDEANNNSYFPNGNGSRIATNTAYVAGGGKTGSKNMESVGVADFWWLRSLGYNGNYAASVRSPGNVFNNGNYVYHDSIAVRPAFNLDLTSVLFTSAAVDGKPDGGIKAIGDYDGSDWELTLLDSSRSFNVTEENASGKPDDTVTLNYTGATTGTNEYVSVIIEQGGELLYYGRIAQPDAESGTVNVTIPADLAPGSYTLNLFSEQYNGDYKTDYASAFDKVTLTVTSDTTKPTLSNGSATRDSETNATVKFTSDEAGKYYYAVVEKGASEPAIDTTGEGTSCDTAEQTISLTALSDTKEKDIYIVVKDAAGNVSDKLKIEIPAYVPTTPIDPSGKVLYVVEHYKADKDATGGYALAETERFSDDIGKTVTATAKNYDGFIYNAEKSKDTASGTLKKIENADDILTLKLYYDVSATPVEPGDTVRYIVKYYQESKDSLGNYVLKETEYPAGKIGNTVSATAKDYAGFIYNAAKSTASGTLKPITSADDIVTLKLYYDIPRYAVTVENSYAEENGSGSYVEGATVSIDAGKRSSYRFSGWAASSGVTLTDASKASTTFTMPAADTTITANWQYNGGGGGSSSGGSSSNNDSTIIDRPDKDDPTTPTTAETKTVKADSKGNVVITKSMFDDALSTAQADAKKNGNTANGIAVVVPVEISKTLDGIQITLKADALDKLVSSGVKRFTIDADHMADFGFTLNTLKELNRQTSGDVILKVQTTAITSQEAKTAIGDRPAYDITLWYLKDGKETSVSLNGKTISVAIPYAPAKGESIGNLYAVYVDGSGKVEWLTKSSYDADRKAVIFEAEHFSIYGVGYKNPVPTFTDIGGHWAKEHILFTVSRGLFSGTGETTFSPDTTLTRGMFVTALGRLAGINPADYQTGTFTDVKADAYYAPYVNWAADKGIVSGTTSTTFAPDSQISREQMAVIMKNYADKMGYSIPKTLEAVTFADNTKISSWAKEAVKAMQQAGVLSGKSNNQFDPTGNATRAEAATVLHRFVEVMLDPQTANGWVQNDSGEWSYYKNGEPVKGWLSNEQKWYWLDKVSGKMFSGGWKQIEGKWYYFYADGSMAVSTKVDGYEVGADGARK